MPGGSTGCASGVCPGSPTLPSVDGKTLEPASKGALAAGKERGQRTPGIESAAPSTRTRDWGVRREIPAPCTAQRNGLKQLLVLNE